MTVLFLPSPPVSTLHLGPVTIHAYALCILAGILAAYRLTARRLAGRGLHRDDLDALLGPAVAWGILGARAYHVATDPELYFGPGRSPVHALFIWDGGLGIWGAVAAGALSVFVGSRRRGLNFADVADAVAPGLVLAQAIGRLGNWFNQELYGAPTTLPWGLEISPANRPPGMAGVATYHPTFLYELLWDLLVCGVLLAVDHRRRPVPGNLFLGYVSLYTLGRFFVESMRIDHANTLLGLRLNDWTSLLVLTAATALALHRSRRAAQIHDRTADSMHCGSRAR